MSPRIFLHLCGVAVSTAHVGRYSLFLRNLDFAERYAAIPWLFANYDEP